MGDNNGCTCGSGGHPRKCEKHPWGFDLHCSDMNHETLRDEFEELSKAFAKAVERITELERDVYELKSRKPQYVPPPRYR